MKKKKSYDSEVENYHAKKQARFIKAGTFIFFVVMLGILLFSVKK